MPSDNTINKSLPLAQLGASARVLLEPGEVVHAPVRLAGKEPANPAAGPIDGGSVLRPMENGAIANRLPS